MTVPVLCLPFAGSGAGFFRAWRKSAPPGIDVVPVQLPGREERTDETPFRDVRTAVDAVLRDAVTGHRTVAVFGHSLGAVLAYELARAVEERTEVVVSHVFVSGSPAPAHGREGGSDHLDDDEFLARVEELAGYRHPAFDSAEFRELLLPTLRADVVMHESYQPLSSTPIEAPVTSLRGADDALVSERDAAAWREATHGKFAHVEVPGGHMYVVGAAARVMALMAETLCQDQPCA